MAATPLVSTKSAMTLVSIFSIVFLVLAIGAQYISRSFLAVLRWLIVIALGGLAAILSYYTALQYFSWATGGAISRLLLPPYRGMGYFAFYSFTEFWAGYLLAICVGIASCLVIKRYARQDQPFFYPEEPLLCLLALSLV